MLKSKVAFCVGVANSPQASAGGGAASPTTSTPTGGGGGAPGKKVGKRRQQYQEKQRLQIEAMQRLLDGKVAEFSVVAGEHRRLCQKLRVLEAVLPASEQHLASLTFSQNGSAPWELMEELFIFDDKDTTTDTACCTESQADAFSPCTTAASDDLTNTANLTSTATVDLLATNSSACCAAAGGASSSSCALPSPPAGCGRAASTAATTTTTTTLRPRNTLASGTVCWRTVGDVLDYVRTFIRECSFLAHSVTAHNNSPRVLARISALVNPLWELVSLKHPDLAHEALYTNVETGEREDLPETFWHDVAAQVQFSEQQLQDMRAAMELYNSKVSAIMNDRLVLGALIDAAMAAQPAPGGASATSSAAMVASVELEVLVRHMQCNLAAELAARRILIEMCSQKIISDYQRAMIFVSSFPYVADISAVVAAVVEMAEASSASGSTAEAPVLSLATATAAAAVQEAAMHNVNMNNAKGPDAENFWPSMLGDGDFMLPADMASMPAIKTEESAMHRKFGRC